MEEIRMTQGQASNRRAALTPPRPDAGDADPSYTLEMEERLMEEIFSGVFPWVRMKAAACKNTGEIRSTCIWVTATKSQKVLCSVDIWPIVFFSRQRVWSCANPDWKEREESAETEPARTPGRRNVKHFRCCSSSCLHCRQPVTSASRLYKCQQERKWAATGRDRRAPSSDSGAHGATEEWRADRAGCSAECGHAGEQEHIWNCLCFITPPQHHFSLISQVGCWWKLSSVHISVGLLFSFICIYLQDLLSVLMTQ